MSIAVTGASGFVGINLVPYLRNRAINVLPLTRIKNSNYNYIDAKYIDEKGIEIMVHLAGIAHDLRKSLDSKLCYQVNTDLTKQLFDSFLLSKAKIFIYLSSIKAVSDSASLSITERVIPNPLTDYGKSKLAAENYLMSVDLPDDKKVYILRPCMIHGPGNKGNLNMLYKSVSKGIPWPLGSFEKKRSYCSIENLCFVIFELVNRVDIPTGVFNVADDLPLSTNELIQLIAISKNKKAIILNIPKSLIKFIANVGDHFKLPLNSERLQKLTDSFLVSNAKLIETLGKPLPINSKDGFKITFQSFKENVE